VRGLALIASIVRAMLALGLLIGVSLAAAAQTRAPAQENLMPISFTWKSTYWPIGLRQWSQTAPDRWTEKYEGGTPDRQFRVLGRMSVDGACQGLRLKSMAEPLEAFIPGSACSSKWLLFRWVSTFTGSPEWVGQAELQEVQYTPASPGVAKPR
jgi:hypothetical protein